MIYGYTRVSTLEQNLDFKSIKDAINKDSATGKFIFNVFTALAQLERDMLLNGPGMA